MDTSVRIKGRSPATWMKETCSKARCCDISDQGTGCLCGASRERKRKTERGQTGRTGGPSDAAPSHGSPGTRAEEKPPPHQPEFQTGHRLGKEGGTGRFQTGKAPPGLPPRDRRVCAPPQRSRRPRRTKSWAGGARPGRRPCPRSGSQGRGHLSGKMTWTDNLNTRGEEVDDGQSDNHVEN